MGVMMLLLLVRVMIPIDQVLVDCRRVIVVVIIA